MTTCACLRISTAQQDVNSQRYGLFMMDTYTYGLGPF
jgi:hypothetical protein